MKKKTTKWELRELDDRLEVVGREIIKVLGKENRSMTAPELGRVTNHANNTVTVHLWKLKNLGLVVGPVKEHKSTVSAKSVWKLSELGETLRDYRENVEDIYRSLN